MKSEIGCIDCGKTERDGVKFIATGRSPLRPLCHHCEYLRYRKKEDVIPIAPCIDCGRTTADGVNFPKRSSRRQDRPLCNSCNYVRHRDTFRSLKVMKYGISSAEFDVWVERIDNRCESCGDEFRETPNIDHCHDTGVIRGFLCRNCNTALGLLGDDLIRVQLLAKYIGKFKKEGN